MAGVADALGRLKSAGGKAFVPYVTGGLPGVDGDLLKALAEAGADAIEVGIPFSDPVMDGPVIQEASRVALGAGATPTAVLELVADAAPAVPVFVMTYLNPVVAFGEARFAERAASCGVSGVIVPDLPVDEAGEWVGRCRDVELAPVFLAAPNSTLARLGEVARLSEGFVYCVSTYGVTGARQTLAGSARSVVEAMRPLTDTPLYVGVGISNPDQAAEASEFADGVVVGSALVRRLLEHDRAGTIALARAFREATT